VKRILQGNPLIGFAIVLLITGLIIGMGVQMFRARDRAQELVVHSFGTIIRIDQVSLGVLNMETGLHGYVLTGSTLFLNNYYLGRSQYQVAIVELMSYAEEAGAQQTGWQEIQALAERWETNWAEPGIQIRQAVTEGRVSREALLDHLIAEREAQEMDVIRVRLSEGKQQVNLTLMEGLDQDRAASREAYDVVIWGMWLSVALGLSSGLLLNWANLRKAKQIELQHLLIEDREQERAQLARDLHDGPVQDLIVTSIALQGLSEGLDPQYTGQLEKVKESLQAVVGDLRAHALELRSPILSKFGFVKAVQAHLETFQRLHPELNVQLEASPEDPLLPEACRETLYRIYQEALNNIARHAGAIQVVIRFQVTGKLAVLEIADNGAGFNPPDDLRSLARQGHLGLVGMHERAEAAGGSLKVVSKPGAGTRLRAVIPITKEHK
jgi:signal transduction histidine kinase